jgi:hypothetical protein
VFKRRLIVAKGSTLYGSDLNKPESWPAANTLTIPSGGNITGLAIISFTSTGSNTIDEILCVFKERELWVVTGTGDFSDITSTTLKFVDNAGSVNQSNIVSANGYLFWVALDDVYLWSGTGKPISCGRPIKPLFYQDGDLDKSKLSYGVGQYNKKQGIIIWFLSHKIFGEQKFQLKLDLKATLPSVDTSVGGASLDGVFLPDQTAFPVYAALSYFPTTPDESLLLGDSSGFLYQGFQAESDAAAAISFKYGTKFLDCGNPNVSKRFHSVIVWVEDIGSWNLTLDWWTDYKSADGAKSTRALPVSDTTSNDAALWDVGFWDAAYWDDYTQKLKPIVFRLASDDLNNSEGKCIKLQFRQEGIDEPVFIAGYSILYSEKGLEMRSA